ncbi:hypothetical protein [Microseira wollei]|uniref:hypothetical protein n=1 Tax=Microseira wollei TaxID=467598 RepID=UPI001CFDD7C1|nr:hypothetical protein [Microseira wollei]
MSAYLTPLRPTTMVNEILRFFPSYSDMPRVHINQPKYQSRLRQVFKHGLPAVFSPQLHQPLITANQPNGKPRIQQTNVTPVPAVSGEGFDALQPIAFRVRYSLLAQVCIAAALMLPLYKRRCTSSACNPL